VFRIRVTGDIVSARSDALSGAVPPARRDTHVKPVTIETETLPARDGKKLRPRPLSIIYARRGVMAENGDGHARKRRLARRRSADGGC
jgi:hypothetical protein